MFFHIIIFLWTQVCISATFASLYLPCSIFPYFLTFTKLIISFINSTPPSPTVQSKRFVKHFLHSPCKVYLIENIGKGTPDPKSTRQHCRLNICRVMLVELTNTVFVNSTNITTNIETATLSTFKILSSKQKFQQGLKYISQTSAWFCLVKKTIWKEMIASGEALKKCFF